MNHQPFVSPVIHHLDRETSIDQAALAFQAGADGVFLISHRGADNALFEPAAVIKSSYPEKRVGLNLLDSSAFNALRLVAAEGLDMVWADSPGVDSKSSGIDAGLIRAWLDAHRKVEFFGSVAFKYQPHEPNPAGAAVRAEKHGMLPTTSGEATGQPPTVAKAAAMYAALKNGRLAVASGMTPENVREYLPYFTHYLVATGVSRDHYHFDEGRLAEFVRIVKAGESPAKAA